MKNRDEELRNNIRANLIDLRTKLGKSQEDIAIEIDRSRNAVGSWEQGLSLPDIETLHRLSVYYKVSMEYFIEHKPDEPKS